MASRWGASRGKGRISMVVPNRSPIPWVGAHHHPPGNARQLQETCFKQIAGFSLQSGPPPRRLRPPFGWNRGFSKTPFCKTFRRGPFGQQPGGCPGVLQEIPNGYLTAFHPATRDPPYSPFLPKGLPRGIPHSHCFGQKQSSGFPGLSPDSFGAAWSSRTAGKAR